MPNFASLSCFYSKLRWGNRVPEYPVQNRVKPGFHLLQTKRPHHKKQSDYMVEQSSFSLITLF